MRITGTIHSIGDHDVCENYFTSSDLEELEVTKFKGILITASDETLRAASNLLCATVDVYPHQPRGVNDLPCTPENYAHLQARLAHAEDNLAREVRSSQALLTKQTEDKRLMKVYRVKYHEADRARQQAQDRLAAALADLARHPVLPPGALEELANALAGCCSWSLNVNDHRSGYETIRDYLTAHGSEGPDEELIAACEASGAVYELQVYERTPVSFVLIKAPSFAALLDEVRGHEWEHISPVMIRDEHPRTQADDDAAQFAQDLADERGRDEDGNALS